MCHDSWHCLTLPGDTLGKYINDVVMWENKLSSPYGTFFFPISTEPPYDLHCVHLLEVFGVIPVHDTHQTGLVFGHGSSNGIFTISGAQQQVAPYIYCIGVLRPRMLLYWECPCHMASTSDLKLMVGFTFFAF